MINYKRRIVIGYKHRYVALAWLLRTPAKAATASSSLGKQEFGYFLLLFSLLLHLKCQKRMT